MAAVQVDLGLVEPGLPAVLPSGPVAYWPFPGASADRGLGHQPSAGSDLAVAVPEDHAAAVEPADVAGPAAVDVAAGPAAAAVAEVPTVAPSSVAELVHVVPEMAKSVTTSTHSRSQGIHSQVPFCLLPVVAYGAFAEPAGHSAANPWACRPACYFEKPAVPVRPVFAVAVAAGVLAVVAWRRACSG